MNGYIKSLMDGRSYGFIRAVNQGEYFFHQQDYNGDFTQLVADAKTNRVEVTFEVVESPKGPRAANVRRVIE